MCVHLKLSVFVELHVTGPDSRYAFLAITFFRLRGDKNEVRGRM